MCAFFRHQWKLTIRRLWESRAKRGDAQVPTQISSREWSFFNHDVASAVQVIGMKNDLKVIKIKVDWLIDNDWVSIWRPNWNRNKGFLITFESQWIFSKNYVSLRNIKRSFHESQKWCFAGANWWFGIKNDQIWQRKQRKKIIFDAKSSIGPSEISLLRLM